MYIRYNIIHTCHVKNIVGYYTKYIYDSIFQDVSRLNRIIRYYYRERIVLWRENEREFLIYIYNEIIIRDGHDKRVTCRIRDIRHIYLKRRKCANSLWSDSDRRE